MRTIDAVRRSAVAVGPERTVAEAAGVMEAAGVGALGVVDEGGHLLGILTDRDLVCRVLARRAPVDGRVDAVMSAPVTTIDAGADLREAFALFRTHALRRLAVVDQGRFVGMVSVDDMLMDVAADLADLVRPVTAEVLFGHHDSPVPVATGG
ncbi:MAG TPA: CBS domain-containing protein [Acidimicrobiales bacterium]|nr:CBS domain-containing protein [Acidimicrobiales bacterium]